MGLIYLVFVDGGHAKTTPGKETPVIPELGRRIKEAEFNFPTARFLGEDLKRHGVHVFYTNNDINVDTPLQARTDYANKVFAEYKAKYGAANVKCVFISIHYNAIDGTFDGANPDGLSVHIYTGHRTKEAGKFAEQLIKYLPQGTPQKARGIIEQNLHVTRETNMVAALTENGFMDNPVEARRMLDVGYQKETGIDHSKAILAYFGLNWVAPPPPPPPPAPKPTPTPAPSAPVGTYRVFVDGAKIGAFSQSANLLAQAEAALKAGKKEIRFERV